MQTRARRTAHHGWAMWANGAPYGALGAPSGACPLQRYALRVGPLVATVLRDASANARI